MSLINTMLYYEDAKNNNAKQDPTPPKPLVAPTSPEIIELFKGVASKDIKEAAEGDKKDESKKG